MVRMVFTNDSEIYDGSTWVLLVKVFNYALVQHEYRRFLRIVNLSNMGYFTK
jgi:hypothetical protein